MPIKKKVVRKTKVNEPALRTFNVNVYPKPFELKIVAKDVENAIEEGLIKFRTEHPELIVSGVNVQQK